MITFQIRKNINFRPMVFVLLAITLNSCIGQERQNFGNKQLKKDLNAEATIPKQNTLFPQIHTNLNGMVREFVRTMYQDSKGNYWFGTNGSGIIRYNGQTLEKIAIQNSNQWLSVRAIMEDSYGHLWFGTSDGLIKFDGENFSRFSIQEGLPNEEIWGLTIDSKGLIWIGTVQGLYQFDGGKFIPFSIPDSKVENPQYMLSDKLVKKILEDQNGTFWLLTDGNGIFKYSEGAFTHLTAENGLTDNNTADLLEDTKGNIWIGTFYGGLSRFDGKTYTNFTKEGLIKGVETYNLLEDRQGNIWFSVENAGVYKYDGTEFFQFTTEDGLTTNGIQSIFEDNKGQIWFGSWQGICIYDGQKMINANVKEPWTN